MHIQPLFAETDIRALHGLIRAYPLATLTTQTSHGLDANLLPLELIEAGTCGLLRGHVARHHPLYADAPDDSALAVFQGPNAYISPRWYVNGQRSGRLAPSWNYVAVQARGRLRFIDDAAWVLAHLTSLMERQEAHREQPWSMADTSAPFAADAAQALVGFEIDILALSGKLFLSQQRTEADRRSVIQHLEREASGTARDLAALIVP
ncbi:FMN-binding negative transcriptional regulator [Variovorax sp. J22P271]|uniref:FMN-binding negative transcriptional regulator n=1 Tax=Variovorax davisae TaxID=3053515 RepID=UPI002577C01C|nr:FMN-binding negative transcriptional regulator [Variovorax sp. J22P271]MDM0030900.1 FMN-binding negative transcriptional regulator [Variovorax sp. J22P271]